MATWQYRMTAQAVRDFIGPPDPSEEPGDLTAVMRKALRSHDHARANFGEVAARADPTMIYILIVPDPPTSPDLADATRYGLGEAPSEAWDF